MAEPGGGFDIRRILLLGAVGVVVVVAAFFFLFRGCAAAPSGRGQSGYTVIYSNLDLKDAANTIARLKELAIPYEIRDDGRAIAVPKNKSDEARIGLAEKNLPVGGAVGWEIFDESKLGATDFDRRIQLIRAISGELQRTIKRIGAVEDARVQIVIPETKLFAVKESPVTASVMIRLRPGAELSAEKINGIVYLVASSVENLQPENVTIIDDTGKILTVRSPVAASSAVAAAPAPAPAPPPEEAVTTTTMVLTKVATAQAEKAVAARPLTPEEKLLLKVQTKKTLETDLAGKAQEILNRFYPPNTVIIKVNADLGNFLATKEAGMKDVRIRKITAIILIDNRIEIPKTLKQTTFQATAAAIGYSRGRGDRIIIQKVPFRLATPPPEIVRAEVKRALPPAPKAEKKQPFIRVRYLAWLAGAAGLFLISFFVFKWASRKPEAAKMEMAEREAPPSRPRATSVESIRSVAENNPERIAELLRKWLSE